MSVAEFATKLEEEARPPRVAKTSK